MIEIERDGRVGIDLKFGTITFKEDGGTTYAIALVDVIVETANHSGTRVQLDVKVPADPAVDSIIAVTDKCRLQIAALLRGAADIFEATTAHALVFPAPPGGA